ncbi:HEAT repeat domain-containing protein [Streptomyces gelaticus]|uniref:HEAT repeat domain-containing protein n=1 Tax=Streptomyces gelaticus TaxID=285446 RepID=UPI0037B14118
MSESTVRQYFVLSGGMSSDFFINLEGALGILEVDFSLDIRFSETRPLGHGQTSHFYASDDGRIHLTVTEDENLMFRYIMLEGDETEVRRSGTLIADKLPVRFLREWQEMARVEMKQDPTLLVKLAIASSEASDAYSLEILRAGLGDGSRKVRLMAVEAASLTQWPALASDLAKAYESDTDDDVRRLAGQALQLLLTANPQGGH